MDELGYPAAHNKRPLSPRQISGPQPPATKRIRMAGSKNLKNHEVALIHQHLLRRNKLHKNTIFIAHGVQQDFQNVRRKIRRLKDAQLKPLEDSEPLPNLPSHIQLRTPSPEPAPRVQIDLVDVESNSEPRTPSPSPTRPPFPDPASIVQIDLVDTESDLESSTQRSEKTPLSMSPQGSDAMSDIERDEMTSEDEENDMEKSFNAALSDLPASEIFIGFRRPDWRRSTQSSVHIHMPPLGKAVVQQEDSLQTFVDRLYNLGYPGRRLSHLKMVLKLIHKGHVLSSYFLETIVNSLDRRAASILMWLSGEINFTEYGARALGTAVCRNDFLVVDTLLANYVGINSTISGPHSTPDCQCQISVFAYAQLQRFNGEGPGASNEMIAYLLGGRGEAEESAELHKCLLGLLVCVLRQQNVLLGTFLPIVQSIIRRIRKFADVMSDTESILETCIHESEFRGYHRADRVQVVEYLLDQGAQTSSGSPLAALIYKKGPLKLVQRLLTKTKNINAYCNSVSPNNRFPESDARPRPYHTIRCINPLQAAALRGNSDKTISLLLHSGADVNCPARGSCGVTALQAMCWFKSSPIWMYTPVKTLLDKGANVNAAPAWNLGLSALQAAAFRGHIHIADLLISRGADVNAPACKYGGGTALAMAARGGHSDMVWFLLEVGAKIPSPGVKIYSLGITYEDHTLITYLLGISSAELTARFGHNGTPTRDYHEYEAEWADDPSYDKEF